MIPATYIQHMASKPLLSQHVQKETSVGMVTREVITHESGFYFKLSQITIRSRVLTFR